VVGHTAYYLPFASAYDSIQQAAVGEAELCLRVFADVGATVMNLHLDCRAPGYDPGWINARNVQAIEALLPTSERLGVRLMVENAEGDDGESLAPVLDKLPTVGLHLDIGHANIGARKSHTPSLLAKYANRLLHVHLSDNKGKSDDHLAIGAGIIDWKRELRTLKATGYDGTMTLECFYGDSELLRYAQTKVQTLWDSL
jgi:sugar phosphate isomerase/epimerase